MDLEGRFVVWLFALLTGTCFGYLALDARYPSLLLAIFMTIAVGVIASGLAHYSLFRPLRRLVAMARAVGSGDFSTRLGSRRRDDIGRLALEMDSMCDQLEAAKLESEALIAALEQLRHSDRVATMGRLVSSVAHELGNPLNVIELRAQLIASDEVTLPLAKQGALVIVEQTRRMTRVIDEILSFVRVHPAKIARIDLRAVLRKSVALCERVSKQHGASIVLEVPRHEVAIEGDADKLLQVVVNLVVNGAQAMPHGGLLRVTTSEVSRAPLDDPEGLMREYVCIDVSDQGTGMAPDVLAKVFRPFFSMRGSEGGTGLGLSVAQGIANEHEGWISATSEVDRGSSFKVYLPTVSLKEAHGADHSGH